MTDRPAGHRYTGSPSARRGRGSPAGADRYIPPGGNRRVWDPPQPLNNNSLKIVHWNVNGWTRDNELIRTRILDKINADIIYINETFLTDQSTIFIDGYTWYGHNRPTKHVNARRGSGGVGPFVRNELFNHFKVEIIDKSTNGIL